MKRIRAIIVEDEKFCIETLKYELTKNCPEVEIVQSCSNGQEGIDAINSTHPDLVFLDVEMPYMNAFEMLKHLDKIDFDLIFTTAYDQFAINAIKMSALDYLLKPVSGLELRQAVDKYLAKKGTGISGKSIEALMSQLLTNQNEWQKIALATQEGLELVRLDQIVFIEADSNYSVFHLISGKKIVISKVLKLIEEMIVNYDYFFRTHQSYIVNLHHVERYHRGNGGSLDMDNGKCLPVSKSRKDPLLEKLQQM